MNSVSDEATTDIVFVAEVLIDSVGLSRIFTYEVPSRYVAKIGIGSYVTIPLGKRRTKGWVVGLDHRDRATFDFDLVPIFRHLGGGPNAEVIALCKWAAWRYLGSPASFLTHASPKKRVSSIPGGRMNYELAEQDIRLRQGKRMLVRVPPTHSRSDWILSHLGDPGDFEGQSIIVCPSQSVADEMIEIVSSKGFKVARFPEEFEIARSSAQVIVGARNATFATVRDLRDIIVVDADDPAHRETSNPRWDSATLACARAIQGSSAILLTSAPSVAMLSETSVMSLSRKDERLGWPKIMVNDISESSGATQLINSSFVDQVKRALKKDSNNSAVVGKSGRIRFEGVVILYNRLGGARTVVCRVCEKVVTCTSCEGLLMQGVTSVAGHTLNERRQINERTKAQLKLSELNCPKCKRTYPAICTNCLSGSLKVVTFGIERFSAYAAAVFGLPITEVDASSEIDPNTLSEIVVGTEAVFSRFESAAMVIIADFDHYLFMPFMDAGELALSVMARAARLLPPRSKELDYVPLLVQSRDVDNIVLKAGVAGDPRMVTSAEIDLRRRLNLPPFATVVKISGKGAGKWATEVNLSGLSDIQLLTISEELIELRGAVLEDVLDQVNLCRVQKQSNRLRFEVNPN